MKAPGYMVILGYDAMPDGGVMCRYRLRTWHPSFWPMFWGAAYKALCSEGLVWSPRAWGMALVAFLYIAWPWKGEA